MRLLSAALALARSLDAWPAAAAVLDVPSQFATIQAAIDAAQAADVVRVAPGTYFERIDFKGKAIEVRSAQGAASTIIDAQGLGIAVRMERGEPESAVLEGFTVRNGTAPTTCCFGGGVQCLGCRASIRSNVFENHFGWSGAIAVLPKDGLGTGIPAHPRIENNRFERNTAFTSGGGIGCYQSHATIEGNSFRDNSVTGTEWNDDTGPAGGAIYLNGAPGFVARENVFVGNRAEHGGGGIFVIVSHGGVIEDNRFVRNEARSGGAVWLEINPGPVTIQRNVFFENRATKIPHGDSEQTYGGAIASFSAPADILDNRFVRNHATSAICTVPWPGPIFGCGWGGALALFGSNVRVERNLLAHNDGDFAGAAIFSNDTLLQTSLVGTIRDNRVTWSKARKGLAAVMCQDGAQCEFDRNEIVDSRIDPGVETFSGGGALTFRQSGASSVTNNLLASNEGQFGGAIAVLSSPVAIRNNTIADNRGLYVPDEYATGAVFLAGGPSAIAPTLENNLFVSNPSTHVREAQLVTPATVRSNLFAPAGSTAWYNIAEGPPLAAAGVNDLPGVDAAGNFDGNPLLPPSGLCRSYRLTAGSIAVDAGDTLRAALPFDLDGEERIAGASVDIGADELHDAATDRCAGVSRAGHYGPLTNIFSLDTSGDGAIDAQIPLGQPGDLPVVGHFTGAFADGIGVYRPASGRFELDLDRNGSIDAARTLDTQGGEPVVGDWDGDGITDLGVFHDSPGIFRLDTDGDGRIDATIELGQSGDRPIVGDWDGDARSDLGVYRPSAGSFSLDADRDGFVDTTLLFGPPGAVPVIGDWNGDGVSDIAIHENGALFVEMDGDGVFESVTALGAAGDLPFSGHFVPEPAAPLGIGSVVGALAVLARRRR